MNTTDLLGSILEPINVERERLEAVKETLRSQMAEVDSQLRDLNRVLRAAEPQEKPGPRKGSGGRAKGSKRTPAEEATRDRLNEQYRQSIRDAIKKVVDSGKTEFNSLDLQAVGLSKSQAGKALQVLRERGEIRFVGNRPNPSPDPMINKPVKTYVVSD